MRILVAEDEEYIAKALKVMLEKNKYTVDMVDNGDDALDYIQAFSYDVLVLDIMMPGMNGIQVLTKARKSGSYTADVISFADISLDTSRYVLTSTQGSVRLNNKEFQLMELFMRNPRIVFSSEKLMDRVWGADSDSEIDVVWTYIGFIRKKLKEIAANAEIKTIRGAGYSLEEIC